MHWLSRVDNEPCSTTVLYVFVDRVSPAKSVLNICAITVVFKHAQAHMNVLMLVHMDTVLQRVLVNGVW